MLKRWLVGNPLKTSQAAHQRLSKLVALAVFSSDALSSVAYATEEILLVLILAGTVALSLAIPISVAIVLLLIILNYLFGLITLIHLIFTLLPFFLFERDCGFLLDFYY